MPHAASVTTDYTKPWTMNLQSEYAHFVFSFDFDKSCDSVHVPGYVAANGTAYDADARNATWGDIQADMSPNAQTTTQTGDIKAPLKDLILGRLARIKDDANRKLMRLIQNDSVVYSHDQFANFFHPESLMSGST